MNPLTEQEAGQLYRDAWNECMKLFMYESSIKKFRQAAKYFKARDEMRKTALCWKGIAIASGCLGDFKSAKKFLSQSRAIFQNMPDSDMEIAKVDMSMAIILSKDGNEEEALKLNVNLKNFFKNRSEHYYTLCCEGEGINLYKLGRSKESIRALREALCMSEKGGNRYRIAHQSEYMAANYLKLGLCDNAVKLLDITIKILSDIGMERETAYFYRGNCRGETNPDRAYEDYRKAIKTIEKKRGNIKNDDYKSFFLANKLAIYDAMICHCINTGRNEDAYEYVQRAKARSFMDVLSNRQNIKETEDNELIRKERGLKREMDLLYSKIHSLGMEGKDISKELGEKEELEKEYENLLREIKESGYEYSTLVDVRPIKAKELRTMLDEQSAVIDYYVTENKTFLFVITKKNLSCVKIDLPQDKINSIVSTTYDYLDRCGYTYGTSIAGNTMHNFTWYMKSTYEKLLKPAEPEIENYSGLIIIPHKSLHHLQFAMLINGRNRYLLEDREITYLSNASLLKIYRDRAKASAAKDSCMIVANPMGDLRYAEKEAEVISGLFEDSKKLLGMQATEKAVIQTAGNYNIVHFACHAKYDTERPLFSHLVLNDGRGNATRLEVNEIFNLKLTGTSLVTLSACETGKCRVSPGDELISMERAFIYAGSSSVIVAMWAIEDETTSELMKEFYSGMKNGKTVSASLRLAQQKIMQEHKSPHLWAAFKLAGEGK